MRSAGLDEARSKRVDRVCSRSTGSHHAHVLFKENYNDFDEMCGERISTIRSRSKGRNLMCFITHLKRPHPDPPSKSDGCDLTKTVHDRPFHCNRRSFRSDGYAQIPYKRHVLPICKAFELEINPIDLFRHLPSQISRFHPLIHSFLHPRRV